MPDSASAASRGCTAEIPPGSGPHAAGLRVLVVDDSTDAANTLCLLLQMSGHRTCAAGDGLQALEQAEAFQPDAVLLDIGLPRLGGHQVARLLRQRAGGERLLLVALSGLTQPSDRQASIDAGCDMHLGKPVNLDRLLGVLAAQRTTR